MWAIEGHVTDDVTRPPEGAVRQYGRLFLRQLVFLFENKITRKLA